MNRITFSRSARPNTFQQKKAHPFQPRYFAAIGIAFILLSVAALVWFGVDFGGARGDEGGPMPDSDHFADDYTTARERFRTRAREAGGRLDLLPLDATGPDGEELSTVDS